MIHARKMLRTPQTLPLSYAYASTTYNQGSRNKLSKMICNGIIKEKSSTERRMIERERGMERIIERE